MHYEFRRPNKQLKTQSVVSPFYPTWCQEKTYAIYRRKKKVTMKTQKAKDFANGQKKNIYK